MDLATYKLLVQTSFDNYGSEAIQVHKFSAIAQDIYRQGARTYDAPVTLNGIVRVKPDEEDLTMIGKRNEDMIMFVFSIKELEEQLSGEPTNFWITTSDIIEHESIKYSVTNTRLTGRVHGGPTTLTVEALEYPDAPV
jgi:hypothetical protein